MWVDPWVWKIPWRKKWQLTLIFLLGKFHGQRSLVGYILEGHKEWNTTECVHVRACACAHTQTHTHISWKSSRLELRKEKKKTFKYINEWIKLSTALSNLHSNQTSDGNIWKQKEIFMSNTIRKKKKKQQPFTLEGKDELVWKFCFTESETNSHMYPSKHLAHGDRKISAIIFLWSKKS